MRKIMTALVLLGSMTAIGQVNDVDDFKEHEDGAYIKTYKDVVQAIHKYNYVMTKNGGDTTNNHYDVLLNPIDFAYIKNGKDKVIITMLLRVDDKYNVFFKEIPNQTTDLFSVEDENGNEIMLTYKRGHGRRD